MKKTFFVLFCAAALGVSAGIETDSVTIAWNAGKHTMAVGYRMTGDPAIVTLSVQRKVDSAWTDLDDRHVTRLAGDVNRVVQPDAVNAKSITWSPDADWVGAAVAAGDLRAVVKAWPLSAPPPYMAVSLYAPGYVRYYASSNAVPGGVQDPRYRLDWLLMRKIEAKGVVWKMGAPEGQPGTGEGGWDWTLDMRHRVTLKRDYYIGVFEFTQGQYKTVFGSNPASQQDCPNGDADSHPVDNVTPANLLGTITTTLRSCTGLSAIGLPTGAEWEYACRAGCGTGLYNHGECNDEEKVNAIAWWGLAGGGNAGERQHAVGQKQPNAWGLYDMLGNVDEAVRDYFKRDLGTADAVAPEFPDPVPGEAYGSYLTTFGGHVGNAAGRIRCSARNCINAAIPGYGFRVMCYIDEE